MELNEGNDFFSLFKLLIFIAHCFHFKLFKRKSRGGTVQYSIGGPVQYSTGILIIKALVHFRAHK